MGRALHLWVGSKNTTKIEVAKHIAKAWADEGTDIIVKTRECDSGIPSGQPYGVSDICIGCHHRMNHLESQIQEEKLPETDHDELLVVIENGFVGVTGDASMRSDVAIIYVSLNGVYKFMLTKDRKFPVALLKDDVDASERTRRLVTYLDTNTMTRFDQLMSGVPELLERMQDPTYNTPMDQFLTEAVPIKRSESVLQMHVDETGARHVTQTYAWSDGSGELHVVRNATVFKP